MTGYSIEHFDELLPFFEKVHDAYLQRYHLNATPPSGHRQFVLILMRLCLLMPNGWCIY
jgi:hypothetical protein